jgi:hypothetical protein
MNLNFRRDLWQTLNKQPPFQSTAWQLGTLSTAAFSIAFVAKLRGR